MRVAGVEDFLGIRNRHLLRSVPDFELDVNRGGLANRSVDAGDLRRLESRRRNRNLVRAHRNRRKAEQATFICLGCKLSAGIYIGGSYIRPCNDSASWIDHRAIDHTRRDRTLSGCARRGQPA
jgi:hypothetical protein